MRLPRVAILLLLSSSAFANIVSDVRVELSQNNFAAANAKLAAYHSQQGDTPEYIEGLSWMGRAALAAKQLDQAETYARQTERLSRQQLYKRKLDAEPHLPIALGASLEVQAQVLAAKGQQSQAVLLLKKAITTYAGTSIRPRLQKNLNMLGMVGQPAPALSINQYLGVRPTALAQLKGSPVFLFFWAHWCPDCKGEAPILTQLRSEYASRGLKVIAPTQLYGYAAGGEDAKPQAELSYIGQIWGKYYAGLQDVPVPVSKTNFDVYGSSTTPTLVLIDRTGQVAMYHPGAMSYNDLRTEIEKVIAN
ncbi:MAG TPA: TlpA disulfide reductase family protein [Terriglobales bacterium]|nr:TlpA disulfide reductase family protein [Terriglobales bacterium]